MDLLVLERGHVGHGEVRIHVVAVRDQRGQGHHVLCCPAGLERRVVGVELVEDLDQHLVVGGGKRREVGHVLQGHG